MKEIFVIFIAVLIFVTLLYVVYLTSEVSQERLNQIDAWVKEYPELIHKVEEYFGRDKQITNSEYNFIEREMEEIKRKIWLENVKKSATQPKE